MKRFAAVIALLVVWCSTSPARATWSIIIIDIETKEVAVGSATCLTSFDLLALTPVVRVGVGGAAVQSAGDFDGTRRPVIRRQFLNETPPVEILAVLSNRVGHQSRQYGIADTKGGAVTFSGSQNGAHASGVVGQVGNWVYAIQGNVITGRPVILEAERAIVETPGDIAEALMASMEAARDMGGDGRCSCRPNDPTGCGSPPPDFNKSAHIGYMILARLGDVDDDQCDDDGCARGDYFMKFNVPFQSSQAPDPVDQLRDMYDVWRAELVGRPDAVASDVNITPNGDGFDVTVVLEDWLDTPLGTSVPAFTVAHGTDSAAATDVGPVTDEGNGTYRFSLTPNGRSGIDRLEVIADDGIRPVTLLPRPMLDFPCGVLVKKLKVSNPKPERWLIKARLKSRSGDTVEGYEVIIKDAFRKADPVLRSLGTTNESGRAKRRFRVETGRHTAVVNAVIPPEGGQCFDESLDKQQVRSDELLIE